MNKYRDIIGRLNYLVFLGVIALLPFPQIVVRYACFVWIICWGLEFRWLKKPNLKSQISNLKSLIPFLLFGLWYGWKLLSGLWAPDHAAWAAQMERYLAFGFLVPVGIWGVNEHYDWKVAGKVLVVTCLCTVPVYTALMTALFYHREIIDTLHWEAVWNYAHTEWYGFITDNISNVKHRLFLCSIELLGAYIAFVLYRNKPRVLIPMLITMLSIIPLTDSRQAIFTVAVLCVVVVILCMPEQIRKRYAWLILLSGMLMGGGIVSLHPRMRNIDMKAVMQWQDSEDPDYARLYIWSAALQHPEDYAAHGLGAGQSTSYLIRQYQKNGLNTLAEKGYHCHSQYLQELMELGIGGLILFLMAWFSIPLCAQGQRRDMAWVFVTIFGCNMLTECMFALFCGVGIWAVGMVLISFTTGQSSPSHAA